MNKIQKLLNQIDNNLELLEEQLQQIEKEETSLMTQRNGLYTLQAIFDEYGEKTVRNWSIENFQKKETEMIQKMEKKLNSTNIKNTFLTMEQFKTDLQTAFQFLFDVGV